MLAIAKVFDNVQLGTNARDNLLPRSLLATDKNPSSTERLTHARHVLFVERGKLFHIRSVVYLRRSALDLGAALENDVSANGYRQIDFRLRLKQ